MTEFQSIMFGFSVIASLFAYFGFRMNDSEEHTQQIFGYVFFSLSLVFINILAFMSLEIANAANLTYLTPTIVVAVQIVMWVLVIFTVTIMMRVFYALIMWLTVWWKERKAVGWRKNE